MALDGRELTFTTNQSYPSADSITTPVGGSWPVGNYSFKVVAWYWDNENQEDNAGVIRSNVPGWANIAVAANDKVIITWKESERPPDHYSVYYIDNATWTANGTIRGRKIAEVQGNIYTSTINKPFLQQGASTNLNGAATSTDGAAPSTILHDTNATFQTDGVKAGDSMSNVTDGSTATVVSVDSEIKLTTTALTGPGDNEWQLNDVWRVTSTTLLVDTAATFVTNGVAVGNYVIINDGSANYAKVVSVDSETQLTTEALTGTDTYTLNDSYDVVLSIFVISTDANSIVINPIKEITPEIRPTMIRSYAGRLVKKAYALATPLESVEYEFYTNTSISEDDLHTIQKWIYWGTRIRISESSEANALITLLDGYCGDIDHIGTRYKSSNQTIRLRFECELGSIT